MTEAANDTAEPIEAEAPASRVPALNPIAEDGHPMWCGACLGYAAGQTNKQIGVCRGGPPTAVVVAVRQDALGRQIPVFDGAWGLTAADKWCLGFRRAPALAAIGAPATKPSPIILPAARG